LAAWAFLLAGSPAAAVDGLPTHFKNSTDENCEIQIALTDPNGGTATLEELDPGTGDPADNAIIADQESERVLGTQSLTLPARRRMRITLDHAPGTRATFSFSVVSPDPNAPNDFQYIFRVTSDLTGARPAARMMEWMASEERLLPFTPGYSLAEDELEIKPRTTPAPDAGLETKRDEVSAIGRNQDQELDLSRAMRPVLGPEPQPAPVPGPRPGCVIL
jgi:hypothetical protein